MNPPRDVALSDLQLDLMRVLWQRGEASTAEVAESLAGSRSLAHTTVATLLTRLEKRGLLAMRRAGGFTIAQDEPTSAVWGMPAAAVGLDAVSAELPLSQIAPAVLDAVARLVVPEAV